MAPSREARVRTFGLCLVLVASSAAAETSVAVLPIEPRAGALQPAEAAALTQELRKTARDVLAPHGFAVVDASGDVASALQAGASFALFGHAATLEGATVVAVGVYKPGSPAPSGFARVVGIGLDQLRTDLRAKIPKLLTTSLGLASSSPEPVQPRGTLRIPSQTKPHPPPPPPPPSIAIATRPAPAKTAKATNSISSGYLRPSS
jgi:hypothetical protein